jgi:hypothetical protein
MCPKQRACASQPETASLHRCCWAALVGCSAVSVWQASTHSRALLNAAPAAALARGALSACEWLPRTPVPARARRRMRSADEGGRAVRCWRRRCASCMAVLGASEARHGLRVARMRAQRQRAAPTRARLIANVSRALAALLSHHACRRVRPATSRSGLSPVCVLLHIHTHPPHHHLRAPHPFARLHHTHTSTPASSAQLARQSAMAFGPSSTERGRDAVISSGRGGAGNVSARRRPRSWAVRWSQRDVRRRGTAQQRVEHSIAAAQHGSLAAVRTARRSQCQLAKARSAAAHLYALLVCAMDGRAAATGESVLRLQGVHMPHPPLCCLPPAVHGQGTSICCALSSARLEGHKAAHTCLSFEHLPLTLASLLFLR